MPVFDKCRPDTIPPAAVIVTVWQAMGRVVADVACTHCVPGADMLTADLPRPVPLALRRAEELRDLCQLRRIVVVLDDQRLWKPEWGALRSLEAVN
jgi:hypothetical protein